MEKVVEKISEYNILTCMVPGALFIYGMKALYQIDLTSEGWGETVFLYYFVGVIISRVGSICVDPLLKKVKLLKRNEYKEYTSAEICDEKISVLQEVGNMYRSFVATFILLGLAKVGLLFLGVYPMPESVLLFMGLIFLIILLTASYLKQIEYVKRRGDVVHNSRK